MSPPCLHIETPDASPVFVCADADDAPLACAHAPYLHVRGSLPCLHAVVTGDGVCVSVSASVSASVCVFCVCVVAVMAQLP